MPSLATSPTLLHRLRAPEDQASWAEFVDLYAPLLHRHALSRGLQQADACDVAQEAMRNIFLALPRYDYRPEKARFRTWLYRVAENQVRQFLRRGRRQPQVGGNSTVMAAAEIQLAAEEASAQELRWQEDWQRQLFRWAAKKAEPEFSPRIWSAFWRAAVESEPAESVAAALGMTRAAVYMARSRCIARLREIIAAAGSRDFDLPESGED